MRFEIESIYFFLTVMAKSKKEQTVDELLRDLLIVQLGRAGLRQAQIREIVGVSMTRVNRIVKHIRKVER